MKLGGREGPALAGVGIEEPLELHRFKRRGTVVGGSIFESIEPAFHFGEAADDDDGETVETGQSGPAQVG